jgi:Salmonella virulence plasmid 65kDa B protein
MSHPTSSRPIVKVYASDLVAGTLKNLLSPPKKISMQCLAATILLWGLALGNVQAQGMTTAGQFAVSESGAATYTIPIQVPPGVAGMQPQLALSYNSQAGNGLLGVGWNLSGLSGITRCPRTMAQDGVRGGVNYNNDDRFCLDGQRLILVAGSHYGAPGSEYRTERESFSRITFDGATFKVQGKAGVTNEYGGTPDSRIEAQGKSAVRVWAINKMTDVTGNYMTYTYDEDNTNGDFRLRQINYDNNQVLFGYQVRTDVSTKYFLGGK